MTLDETAGRIWADNHRAFTDWADGALGRIGVRPDRPRMATLLSVIAALTVSLTLIGGSVA